MNDARFPCEHGRYEVHILNLEIFGTPNRDPDPIVCSGGRSLSLHQQWTDRRYRWMSDWIVEHEQSGATDIRQLQARSVYTCDWGDCDKVAVVERFEHENGRWLPVCEAHR